MGAELVRYFARRLMLIVMAVAVAGFILGFSLPELWRFLTAHLRWTP